MIKWMGVDFGDKRIGLSIGDDETRIALCWQNYARRSPDVDADYFKEICRAERVQKIVVGLPIRTTGKEGERAKASRRFGAWIKSVTGREVYFFDERFTTQEADAKLAGSKLPKKKRKARRDMIAAQIMLQDFIDSGCPKDATPDPLDDAIVQSGRLR